jgi:hypothetical protein
LANAEAFSHPARKRADRIDGPSFSYRWFPHTAAAGYHCSDF